VRLLVSVSSATEAASALAGGADIIDAKDPLRGALGPVSIEGLRDIRRACGDRVPMTAALGDAESPHSIEGASRAFSAAGAVLVKIGFADIVSRQAIEAVLRAARRGVAQTTATGGVIAVAYADAERVASAAPRDVLDAAVATGAAGILLDTADKNGPGLRALMPGDVLRRWISLCRDAGLMVAVAGKLSADDIDWLATTDIDIVGVRGAACEGGRLGVISASRVRMLRAGLVEASRHQRSPV
jgi:(5-formylfuran-3-yl)methyl phosphate synthase